VLHLHCVTVVSLHTGKGTPGVRQSSKERK
jgi:hypothetical protein